MAQVNHFPWKMQLSQPTKIPGALEISATLRIA
jgi:hypothetical protein